MNLDDVIRMAREAGDDWEHTLECDKDFLERFAAIVAVHERNECAKNIEAYCGAWDDGGYALAAAIRARGQA